MVAVSVMIAVAWVIVMDTFSTITTWECSPRDSSGTKLIILPE